MRDPFDPRVLQRLRHARRIAVLSGAGISGESGIPTFRDAQTGLWSRFRPEELATPDAFRRNPQLVWDWYEWRRGLVARAEPNAGHRALAQMEALVPALTLITQNVDGLHQRAGSRTVIELHGNIWRNKCFAEGLVVETEPLPAAQPATRAGPPSADAEEPGSATPRADPPRCLRCGAYLRPDVVWFGETLPAEALADAETAARECDVFFSIGTSAVVFPAAQLPVSALQSGAAVIEINKDATPLTAVATFSLRGEAGTVLPRLISAAWGE